MIRLSIAIVALNEEKFLPGLLLDLISQTYDHSLIEVLLIDSGSVDETEAIMFDFMHKNPGKFSQVKVLKNQKKIQAAGWNVAINNYTGDALSRIDAHSKIDKDFCKYVVEDLENGEYVVGGKRPCILGKNTKWAKTLLQVENSLFGSSILNSRSSDQKQYVKTMFHATYKREVINDAGLFNEELLRTEDNEYHYRISKLGYKLFYDPRIISFQYTRDGFGKMIIQKYKNGFWIGKTVKYCQFCISIYHMVPFAFLLGILVSSILSLFGIWQISAILWFSYILFALVNTFISGVNNRFFFYHLIMPLLFFALHCAYGLGTMIGLFSKKQVHERDINNKYMQIDG